MTIYRVICEHIDLTDVDGNDVAFTTKVAARKWVLQKLEKNGDVGIYELVVDPKMGGGKP